MSRLSRNTYSWIHVFFFCLRTSLSGTKDSKMIDTRFMLFCHNLLHLCLHVLRFFQIWHRKLPCSVRSQKAIYGDRFKYTSAQLLCLVLLCLCSSQKEIPKWHVVSVQPPPPPPSYNLSMVIFSKISSSARHVPSIFWYSTSSMVSKSQTKILRLSLYLLFRKSRSWSIPRKSTHGKAYIFCSWKIMSEPDRNWRSYRSNTRIIVHMVSSRDAPEDKST